MSRTRLATNLLSLSIFLSLLVRASPALLAQAAPAGGVVAHGSATLQGSRGARSGAITVAAWGAGHCKITIALDPAGLHRRYSVIVNGKRVSISAPAGLAAAVPLPVGPGIGCGLLLPQGASPATLAWDHRGTPVTLTYADHQGGGALAYPGTITESIGGKVRLTVHFASIETHSFTESDFALPPPLTPLPARTTGGGK